MPGAASEQMLPSRLHPTGRSAPMTSTDWRQGAYTDNAYTTMRTVLASQSMWPAPAVLCAWCREAAATTPDHQPPLAVCSSLTDWRRRGGYLIPACLVCNSARGDNEQWAPAGIASETVQHNIRLSVGEYGGLVNVPKPGW